MIVHKKKIYVKIKRTKWKVITTRQSEQNLYWCRIPDHSWSRTVFHDERHWRILTMHRFSGLSWVHSAKRRKFIWTKRLDSREHQDWTRIGSYNLLQGKYGVEIRIESMNKDHSHSWVRISHGLNKLVTDSSNNKEDDDNEQETSETQFEDYALKLNAGDFVSRSKDKANNKEVLLPAHPQKLCLLGKELGLILNHKNIRSPTIQCQRNWSIFFVMVVYHEKMMERLNSGE